MKKFVFSILVVVFGASEVMARDVLPVDRRETNFVKVTVQENGQDPLIAFQLCSFDSTLPCTQIGKKSSYTTSELVHKRRMKYLKSGGVVGLDVVVIAAGVAAGMYGGAVLMTGVFAGGFLEMGLGMILGGVTGGGVGAAVAYTVKALNPAEPIREAKTVNDDIIADKTIYTETDLATFAKRLEAVLD